MSLRRTLVATGVVASLLVPNVAIGQGNQPYQDAAQQTIKNPFRVDIQPAQQAVKQGSSAVLKIQLRNANSDPVNANQAMTFIIKAKSPTLKEQTQKLEIASGKSSGEVTLVADEAGLWKLEVRENNDHLVGGSSYLMVMPVGQGKSAPKPPQQPTSKRSGAFLFAPRLVLAAYKPQDAPAPAPTLDVSQSPKIMLTASGDTDNRVMADGTDAANVQLFLYPPQPNDVRVFLNVSHGSVSPQMLTIKAGEVAAAAKWTSKISSKKARISVTDVNPRIEVKAPGATVDFVDPIVAIAFENPPSLLNIVERGIVTVKFVDRNGAPVQSHEPVSFSFSSNSARVQLVPGSEKTKPDAFEFQASIIPSGLGQVTIEAAVPHLPAIKQTVEVKGLLLLLLCALGGALGGLVNHLDRKQKGLIASLTIGMVVALPITWLYVCVGLPHIDTAILHNQLSAVMVAIIAGVTGAGGLKIASQKFGFNLFEPAAKSAVGAAA